MPARIELKDLASLRGAPMNAKQHDAGAIRASILRFGYVAPILLDERTGRIVAGHGRVETLRAMKVAGQPPPKGITAKAGRWLVPVITGVEFKSDEDAAAYAIADNRLVELGGWNEKDLSVILSDLAAQQSLDGTGFDPQDVDDLLKRLAGQPEGRKRRVAFNARECTKACPVHCEKGKK